MSAARGPVAPPAASTAGAGSPARSVHVIFELALVCPCPQCSAAPAQLCAFSAAGQGAAGAHLARFAAARTRHLISEPDMAAVLEAAGDVFTPAAVVYDNALGGGTEQRPGHA